MSIGGDGPLVDEDRVPESDDGLPDTLVEFAKNPRTFIYSILLGGLLNSWAWILDNVVARVFEVIELGLVEGIAIPIRDGFTLAGSSVYDSILQFQLWAADGIMSFGVAAPFALAISWFVIALIVAVISQLLWGLVETYLPVESVSGALNALISAFRGESS